MEKEVARIETNLIRVKGIVETEGKLPLFRIELPDSGAGTSLTITQGELADLMNLNFEKLMQDTNNGIEELHKKKQELKSLSEEVFALLTDPRIFKLLTNQGNDYRSTLTQLHSLVQTNPACNGLVGDSRDLALALVNEYIGVDVGEGFYGTVEFLTHDFGKGKRVVISTRMVLDNPDEISMKELEHWEMLRTMYDGCFINEKGEFI